MKEINFFTNQARNDFLSYCIFTDKRWETLNHHKVIAEHLEAVMNWKIQKLAISMPPRAWKTREVSEFVSYYLWHRPQEDIIYTWHSVSLLEWISKNIRERVQSKEYWAVFDTRIKRWSEWVKEWTTEDNWSFMIFWTWGWITWKWFNLWIIDDPYATREDAESETIRRKVSEWYWSTWLSRRHNDKATQIVIMQRWREDDLIWEILDKEWDEWTVLKIPAIDDDWHSFWPSKFSLEYFQDTRAKIWESFFQSQYQQDPVNEWWWAFKKEYFEYESYNYLFDQSGRLSKDLKVVSFIDPAISQKQDADYTAIVTLWLDRRNNDIYILDIFHERCQPDRIIEYTFQLYDWLNPERIWLEVVQYQKMLALEMQKQMKIKGKFFTLDEIRPMGEKEARIKTTLQPRYSNHTIYHIKWKYWELENELLKFPNGKHDDIIDALSWAVMMLDTSRVWHKPWVHTIDYSDYI